LLGDSGEPPASDMGGRGEHDRHLRRACSAVALGIALRSCGPARKTQVLRRAQALPKTTALLWLLVGVIVVAWLILVLVGATFG
jgi:hypothetical protein